MESVEGNKFIKKPLADEENMWNCYRQFVTETFRDMVLDFSRNDKKSNKGKIMAQCSATRRKVLFRT